MRTTLAQVGMAGMLLVGCAAPGDDGRTGGKLVYETMFDGSGIPAEWSTQSNRWSIEDGWVAVSDARNEGLWLRKPLPEKVRIEFLARSLSEEGDIKFEIFTDGATHESGYVGIFGGWSNALNIIARLDEHGNDRLVGAPGRRVEKGRTYRMAVVRTDNRVRWYIDGEPFLTYSDAAALRGEKHAYFGFNDWAAPLRFDEVRVWDLGAK